MAERYDLVVVGAGPGGSSAAYHSAKAGLEHPAHRQAGVPQGQDLWRRPDAARRFGDSTDGAGRLARRAAPRQVYGILHIHAHSLPAPKRPPFLARSSGYVARRKETDAKLLERAISLARSSVVG